MTVHPVPNPSVAQPSPQPPSGAPVPAGAEAVMNVGPKPPIVFARGDGSYLFDTAGRRYLDFVQGWAVNTFGHAPALLAETLARQAATLVNCSPAFYNDAQIAAAGKLAALSGLGRVFFASTGAEANEGAIKLARKWGLSHRGGAHAIITFRDGFHGRTLATMSASGKAQWDGLFEPRVPGFPKADLNDIASVERLIGPDTVAVMLEPIQGEAGVIPATDGFLADLRALTRDRGILLILDEIQTGIGRTGKMFAFEHAGIRPDILTLAKGLGGGFPVAALVADEAVSCFEPGDQGGTFGGNALATAVAGAILDAVAAPGFLERVTAAGDHLGAALVEIAQTLPGSTGVRGRGLLLALDLGADIARDVTAAAMARGLLVNAPRPRSLRFMPSLTVGTDEIDAMIALLKPSIKAARGG
jgi:acetylornithine/N-succinyldiaminopimelate aminotransferase